MSLNARKVAFHTKERVKRNLDIVCCFHWLSESIAFAVMFTWPFLNCGKREVLLTSPRNVHASRYCDLTSAEEYPDEEYLDTSKSSSLRKKRNKQRHGRLQWLGTLSRWLPRKICELRTCLCLKQLTVSHLGFGLRRSSLCWEQPAWKERAS